ncbi:hypothetical protein SprV_1002847100 [Sparganum proliferum]
MGPVRDPKFKSPQGKLNIVLLSLPARHLEFSNELPQRLDNVPIANAADAAVIAANENGCVENSLGTQSSPRRWPSSFAHPATYSLLFENDRLQKTYIDHPFVDDNTDACYRFRRLVQQRLREMQNARTARKAVEI